MNRFSELMAELAPQGWWRLGEPIPQIGGLAEDASAYRVAGRYQGSFIGFPQPLSVPGAIVTDSNTAVAFAGGTYVEVPDHDIYSLAKANDSFQRHASNGWGDADHGGTWSAQVSNAHYFSCASGVASIDETHNSGTWMIGLPIQPYNADIQIETSWDDVAKAGPLSPCSLVARRKDNGTYYQAELVEQPDHSLELSLYKHVGGVQTRLAVTPNIGSYASREGWILRFQLDGPNLRARAWNQAFPQPAEWQVTAADTAIYHAGGISVRSGNSSSQARPTVKFSHFWVQTLGLTLHTFLRIDRTVFHGENSEGYIHWLGKGEGEQQEWTFRLYSQDSQDAPAHTGWVSFYVYSPSGGRGAGAAYQATNLGQLVRGRWYQFVGVLDPGDWRDSTAGATIYKDGARIAGPPMSGSLYSSFQVTPGNGSAPLRFATRDTNSFLTGALDEIAIFDRKLTDDQISQLYEAAILHKRVGPP